MLSSVDTIKHITPKKTSGELRGYLIIKPGYAALKQKAMCPSKRKVLEDPIRFFAKVPYEFIRVKAGSVHTVSMRLNYPAQIRDWIARNGHDVVNQPHFISAV